VTEIGGREMGDRRSRYTVDWGHLIFLTVIAAAVFWYFLDAMSVSLNIHNLLLVAPLSVLALCLCLVILPQCFRRTDDGVVSSSTPDVHGGGASALHASNIRSLLPIGGLVLALGLYVSLLDVIGFDVATCLFVLAVMLICGERRPLPLVLYPLLVSLILISAFRAVLPYPMYTAII
jgi:hypothetical protein